MKAQLGLEKEQKELQVINGKSDRVIVHLPPDQFKTLNLSGETNFLHDKVLRQKTSIHPRTPLIREVQLSPDGFASHLIMAHSTNPEISSQFNLLVIGLIKGATTSPPLNRILIASAHHMEGRTWVTLNLATALARAGKRVLIIDTDLKRPSVIRLLGIESEFDLVDVIANKLSVEAALTKVLPVGFDVLPTRKPVENSTEILASSSFRFLLSSLEFNYDFILLDSAPLLTSSDAGFLVLHTYATVMVVEPGITSTIQMSKAVSQLREDTLFGVVLNRVN